jgi:hypothetical protein
MRYVVIHMSIGSIHPAFQRGCPQSLKFSHLVSKDVVHDPHCGQRLNTLLAAIVTSAPCQHSHSFRRNVEICLNVGHRLRQGTLEDTINIAQHTNAWSSRFVNDQQPTTNILLDEQFRVQGGQIVMCLNESDLTPYHVR